MTDRPKLTLLANIPAIGVIQFDSPKTGTHAEYGDWFLYCVKVDGVDHNWFATEQSNGIVQHLGLKKDSTVEILKQ